MHKRLITWQKLFGASWSSSLQYRGDFILWSIAQAATPLIALAIWFAVANQTKIGLTPQDTLTYYVIILFINRLISGPDGYFLSSDILSGQLVQNLIKPHGAFTKYVITSLAYRSIFAVTLIPLFIAILFIFSNSLSPAIYSASRFSLFILSSFLALILYYLIDMTLGTIAFWIEEANEVRRFKFLIDYAASGILIPYALLPNQVFSIFTLLPFRYTLSAPAEILLDQIKGPDIGLAFTIQIAWIIVFALLFSWFWKKGLRVYAIPGQ